MRPPTATRPRLEALEDRLAPDAGGPDVPDHGDPARDAEHAAFRAFVDSFSYESVAVGGDFSDPATWGGAPQDPDAERDYYLSWVDPLRLDGDPDPPDIAEDYWPTLAEIGRSILPPYAPPPGGGHPPGPGDDVHIPAGVTVTLDTLMSEAAPLGMVYVEGTLAVDPSLDTRLWAEHLFVAPGGRLVADGVTGHFDLLFSPYSETFEADPTRLGGGLVSHGQVILRGAPTPTHGPLGTEPAGHTVMATGSNDGLPAGFTHHWFQPNRHVTIRDQGLTAQDSAHVMLMHGSGDAPADHIAYVSIGEPGNGLGRTDKSLPLVHTAATADANVSARYAAHVHFKDTDAPVLFEGVIVFDPTSWAVVNHNSHVVVKDSVSWGARGAAFVDEDVFGRGAFEGNLAYQTFATPGGDAENNGDMGGTGAAFWKQSTDGTSFTDNLAVEASTGYVIWGRQLFKPRGDVESANLLADFSGNTAIGAWDGLHVQYATNPGNRIDGFKAWGVRGVGITLRFADAALHGPQLYGILGRGTSQGIKNVTGYGATFSLPDGGHIDSFDIGMDTPRIGDKEVAGVTFAGNLVTDIYVSTFDKAGDTVLRDIAPDVTWRWNVNNTKKSERDFFSEHPDRSRRHLLVGPDGVARQIFAPWQVPDFVLRETTGPFAGLSNRQVYETYGLLPVGGMVTDGAVPLGDGHLGAPAYRGPDARLVSRDPKTAGAYTLVYDWGGERFTEEVTVASGWNLFTRERGGEKYTFMVKVP